MKFNNLFKTFLPLIFLFCALSSANAQPNIPKDEIPANLPKEIKNKILLLYSTDAAERGNAAMQLREFRAKALKPTVPFLMGMLHDDAPLRIPSRWVSIGGIPTSPGEESAKTLGKIGSSAVKPLIEALEDDNQHVRKCAAIGLAGAKDPQAIDPLLALFNKEPYSTVLSSVVEALGKYTDPKVIEPLIESLGDEDWAVREKAAYAFKNIKERKAVAPLLKLLKEAKTNDKSSIVRNAESALGNITGLYVSYDNLEKWEEWLKQSEK